MGANTNTGFEVHDLVLVHYLIFLIIRDRLAIKINNSCTILHYRNHIAHLLKQEWNPYLAGIKISYSFFVDSIFKKIYF